MSGDAWELVTIQGGIERPGYTGTEAEMRDMLEKKHASHIAHGWTVERDGDSLRCFKAYEKRSDKDRIVLIRESK